eukprot:m.1353112 g.1353112  ORF g.1353112 m.1353112 type:complete len:472 (+) comp24930_c1_seq7:228-1643(+)
MVPFVTELAMRTSCYDVGVSHLLCCARNLAFLNFSSNNIYTMGVYPDEIGPTRVSKLQRMILSNNSFPVLYPEFAAAFPFARLDVSHSGIIAMPMSSSRLFSGNDGAGNILSCEQYSPALVNCTCAPPYVWSSTCGFGRCTLSSTGCSSDMYVDLGNCSSAPYSVCLAPSNCSDTEYQAKAATATSDRVCLSLQTCDPTNVGVLRTYEYVTPTATSNRQCSICSKCESGFHENPCTATSETTCTRGGLTSSAIGVIVLSIILLSITALSGYLYGRRNYRRGKLTMQELEQTELLLSDVTEKHDRMKQAWIIEENDISLEAPLASGTFGTVWRGRWGHIKVAVKRLRIPISELDPLASEEFDKEVTFMQSIRHPNVLALYGAGVTGAGMAYLVVEFMNRGSLRTMLHDITTNISWGQKLSFAIDIARGTSTLRNTISSPRLCTVRLPLVELKQTRINTCWYTDAPLHKRDIT